MDRRRIAIIIPALDEQATIVQVVARVGGYGRVIVVDDGSRDDTAALARRAGADVVVHQRNLGYDGALNSGFARADALGCEYAITCDADGQHDPRQIGEFVALLDQGYELVLGVRDRRARLAEHLFAFVARQLWGVRDPLCGMKGYRMALYRQQRCFDSVGSIGSELAIRAAARGVRLAQRPTAVRDRADQPRFGRRLGANLKILRAMATMVSLGLIGRLAR